MRGTQSHCRPESERAPAGQTKVPCRLPACWHVRVAARTLHGGSGHRQCVVTLTRNDVQSEHDLPRVSLKLLWPGITSRLAHFTNGTWAAKSPSGSGQSKGLQLRAVILAVNLHFESKGQSLNRSLQYFHVLHSSMWPARMRFRDQSVLQVTLYAQASETSWCQALLICQRPRLSPPSPMAHGWWRDSCVTIHSAT
jgi:hypothetical protein